MRRLLTDYERRRAADYERESVIQHSTNIHASLKHDRWPDDRGRVMEYLRHNTLRTWSFRPASLSILHSSSKDLLACMVDELTAEKFAAPF